ncbi:helix-turn-helix transcriptional regulator [Pseudarthrobacter sp. B907]|uniref:helix-turn-helix domain-containing protein n=1 Tax=Pseudarthrobacter sp. B907 TaxID=3158261 RepID=UPI0032DABB16
MENIQSIGDLSRRAEQDFGQRVRSLRAAAGMTQAELADKVSHAGMNMTQGMIAKLERGARPTSVGELAVLGQVFGVSSAQLLEAGQMSPESARLAELRLRLTAAEAGVIELAARWEQANTALEVGREKLRGAMRAFQDGIEGIIRSGEGEPDWAGTDAYYVPMDLEAYVDEVTDRGKRSQKG